MLDIKYIREHLDEVKENLKKKFQEHKASSVDKLIELDSNYRDLIKDTNNLKQQKNYRRNQNKENKK